MNFVQKKYSTKKSGETLIEVLIAVTILIVFLVGTLTIMNQALFLNENIRSRVIALNLSREGLEGVRHVRDTNWLRFSGDKRSQWLCADKDCSSKLEGGSYRIDFDTDSRTFVFQKGINGVSLFDDFYSLKSSESSLFLNHASADDSLFYRRITFEMAAIPCPEDFCSNKIIVQSEVGWDDGKKQKSLILETHLFDYYERDAY